jgi:hypothetical protein
MRVLSYGLVVIAELWVIGCGVDSPVIRICEPSQRRSLDLSAQSALGFSGKQLTEQAVGSYDVTATRGDATFPATLKVTSDATTANETDAGKTASMSCPSTLEAQAHFELTAAAGELEGAWDGRIIGSRESSAQGGFTVRGEATVARGEFTSLPSDFSAGSFSFYTNLGASDVSGSLLEIVEPGKPGSSNPTPTAKTVATWSATQ